MAKFLILFLLAKFSFGFKECSSGSDTVKPQIEYLVTPFFPHRTPRAVKCKFSLSVNYGEYIKLVPDVIEVPCAGQNGIYVEEEGGRSGPFCGNKRMPSFISRDVKFDIHILIDTPLRGARVKIGYKTVTSPKGPNVAKVRGNSKLPVALLKMAPDQGQGQLQQQNLQNPQNEVLNSQQEIIQKMGPPSNGFGKQPTSRRGYDKNKQWVSHTYNPVVNYPESFDYPEFTGPGKDEAKSSSAGVQLVLPVLVLMILIGVLIMVIHKRRQRMKEDLKKMESAPPGEAKETRKRDFIPIETGSLEKTEPTIEQINHVIEATNNAAEIENTTSTNVETPTNRVGPTSKVIPTPSNKTDQPKAPEKKVPPTPANTLVAKDESGRAGRPSKNIDRKTVSTDSAISTKSKDSQATTAPSIKSECPTRPLRAPVVRPSRKKAPEVDDNDRPSY